VPVEVVCPTCNTTSRFDELSRDASCFCPTCDYPLFWARTVHFAGPPKSLEAGAAPAGRRRLPGTEGWAVHEKLLCPSCSEPNLLTGELCVRCGAELYPRPPLPAPKAPPPPPAPKASPAPPVTLPPRRRRWWPWVVAAFVPVLGLAAWLIVSLA
jgi:DNA-directed RNA polymerase subunit RPC12/RpoP